MSYVSTLIYRDQTLIYTVTEQYFITKHSSKLIMNENKFSMFRKIIFSQFYMTCSLLQ